MATVPWIERQATLSTDTCDGMHPAIPEIHTGFLDWILFGPSIIGVLLQKEAATEPEAQQSQELP
jgi:hypothetical protein